MFSAKDIFQTKAKSGYTIAKSLRFRRSASAYLNRTYSTPTNNKIWTLSAWVKRANLAADQTIIGTTDNNLASGNIGAIRFTSANAFEYYEYSSAYVIALTTTQVFRDPSAWYHIVIAVDTTQATASNRIKMYANGSQITSFSTSTYPSLNYNPYINSAIAHYFGAYNNSGAGILGLSDAYFTEINFIDGQALDPTYFGQTDTATGVWMPKKYTGTYGTNGFYLNFSDASAATAAAIGKDSSGNGKNWTPTNISVTAGVTYDSMVDTPTNYDNGGNGAGNYATFNVNNQIVVAGSGGSVVSQANLLSTGPASASSGSFYPSTIAASAGKWYAELTVITAGTANSNFGIVPSSLSRTWSSSISVLLAIYNSTSSNILKNGSTIQSGLAAWANGDVCGIAIDLDAGTVQYYRNGSAYGSQVTSITTVEYCIGLYTSQDSLGSVSSAAINFGQRPFTYTPPSGFKALCTQNLPTPTIGATSSTLANKYFDATLYTGNGTSQNIVNSGAFQPDFVWVKLRSAAASNILQDTMRGAGKSLVSNTTAAETGLTGDLISSFNSNGFTVNINLNGGSDNSTNFNAGAFVGWQWKANGSGSSNTSGTITSTVSANVTAGFSVVTYTGTGANATVGHGLGVAPKMVIVKQRSGVNDWAVYHASILNTEYLLLDTTGAKGTSTAIWNSTTPTSSVFSIGAGASFVNTGSATYVAYCFAEVAGYSKFGSLTGNASADGSFVYLGFKPKLILIKCSSTTGNWYMFDTVRNTYNVLGEQLYPNLSNAGSTVTTLDALSNGFKLRLTGDPNAAQTYIFAAWADVPFNFARAM